MKQVGLPLELTRNLLLRPSPSSSSHLAGPGAVLRRVSVPRAHPWARGGDREAARPRAVKASPCPLGLARQPGPSEMGRKEAPRLFSTTAPSLAPLRGNLTLLVITSV